ncbi:CAP domain-containing protein [Bacillus tianshenii]|nr:CAP domain-containing protein [Bacillus tianshenii]
MKKWLFLIASAVLSLMVFAGGAHAQNTVTHIVKPGETLWIISQKYKENLWDVIRANPQLENPNLIYPYQKIKIPHEPSATRQRQPNMQNMQGMQNVEKQVVQLTNQERAKQGLKPLQADASLAKVARTKSADMRDKGYFSHNSPTYGSPFNMMKQFGIQYTAAAENIAAGQPSPEAVVKAWMDSPGHRRNILNPDMTHIGVGYAEGGSYGKYWTQMFIRK